MVIDKSGKHLKYKLNGIAFRPRLTMVITDFKTEIDEWNLKGNWTINAREV